MRHLSDVIYDHHPLVLPQTATVKSACLQMSEHMAGSVLVTDEDGRLVGIFTGRDAVCSVLAAGKGGTDTRLSQVMTPHPATMSPDRTAIEALRVMWDCGCRHLPLVQNGRLLGVVSRGDFNGEERARLEDEREYWEHMR